MSITWRRENSGMSRSSEKCSGKKCRKVTIFTRQNKHIWSCL
uniref:Uncharacterized protein n=1 Tax=Rhizophora mucronata TaxID=61149 RepID=A0A2P2N9S9_RHIMU